MRLIRDVTKFTSILFEKRDAIWELAKRDFEAQFKGTYLGIFWGIAHPLTYIVVLFLVFTFGLRSNPGLDVPFVLYLISGMIPWQFFSGTLTSLTGVVSLHAYLVRKGNTSLAILHVAKIVSSLFSFLILIAICLILSLSYGYPLGFHSLQIIYYLTALCLLLLGLGWITSSTSLFVEDVHNIVSVIIQFGFWLTPVIWNMSHVPTQYQWLIKLNPTCYIVTGFRDSLIYGTPFWAKPQETIYFWCFTLITLLAGVTIFRKLKPHFGEVL